MTITKEELDLMETELKSIKEGADRDVVLELVRLSKYGIWAKEYAIPFLKHLREAAPPDMDSPFALLFSQAPEEAE